MYRFGLVEFARSGFRAWMATMLVSVIAPSGVAPATTTPPLQTVDLSADQASIVRDVVDLFAQAGLELPPVVVQLGDGDPRCDDRPGLHYRVGEVSVIHMCYPKIAGREFRVLAHELAHAWARNGLSDERRAAFRSVRGWEHWHDYEQASWRDNGTEQVAEIIKWGVSDISVPVFVDHDSCDDLRAGYRALTGTDPPHGRTELCDQDDTDAPLWAGVDPSRHRTRPVGVVPATRWKVAE